MNICQKESNEFLQSLSRSLVHSNCLTLIIVQKRKILKHYSLVVKWFLFKQIVANHVTLMANISNAFHPPGKTPHEAKEKRLSFHFLEDNSDR